MVVFMLNIGFDTSGSDEDVVALQESYFGPVITQKSRLTEIVPVSNLSSPLHHDQYLTW